MTLMERDGDAGKKKRRGPGKGGNDGSVSEFEREAAPRKRRKPAATGATNGRAAKSQQNLQAPTRLRRTHSCQWCMLTAACSKLSNSTEMPDGLLHRDWRCAFKCMATRRLSHRNIAASTADATAVSGAANSGAVTGPAQPREQQYAPNGRPKRTSAGQRLTGALAAEHANGAPASPLPAALPAPPALAHPAGPSNIHLRSDLLGMQIRLPATEHARPETLDLIRTSFFRAALQPNDTVWAACELC